MMEALTAVTQVLVAVFGAWAVGRRLRGRFWIWNHPALGASADAALGLLLVSHAIFLAVLLNWAVPAFFAVLLLLLAAAAVWELLRQRASLKPALRGISGLGWVAAAGAGYAAFVLALSLPPPSAVDELVYHLEVPRRILAAGGAVFFPDNVYAYFPELGEMLFAFGLAIGGEVAAKLFHAVFGGLLALAVYGFARQRMERGPALAAAGFLLAIPSVAWVASLAYVDLSFALYGFLALAAVMEGFREGGLRWAVAAGLMAGGAWSVKYTGLQFALLLALLVLLEHLSRRRKGIPWAAPILGAVALLTASPYLLRNWAVTGWPLFPFQLPLFALNPAMNWDAERSQLFLRWLSGFGGGLEAGPWSKLLSPVLVFVRARFDHSEAYDGVLGPVFLLVPLLLFSLARKGELTREMKILAGFSLAFLYYWSLTTQQVRFLLPAMPALAVLLAFGLSRRRSWMWRGAAAALVLVGLALGSEKLIRARPWDWWSGRQNRQEYLDRRVLGRGIYAEASRVLKPGDRLYLVNMRNFGYLLDCDWRSDFIFEYYRLGKALEQADSSEDLVTFFRRQGITHLMIDEGVTLSPVALEAREQLILRDFLQRHATLAARDAVTPRLSLWALAQP